MSQITLPHLPQEGPVAPIPSTETVTSSQKTKRREDSPLKTIDDLPPEVRLRIFSHLDEKALARCCSVKREWNAIGSDESLWKALFSKITFGKQKLETYFGEVGEEPPLPPYIHKFLKSRPAFLNGKSIEETHILVLIPATIDGRNQNKYMSFFDTFSI